MHGSRPLGTDLGNARPAHPQDALHGRAPRLRHRPAHPEAVERLAARGGGLALPRAAAHAGQGVRVLGVEALAHRAPGPLLQAYGGRPPPARARRIELPRFRRCHQARTAAERIMTLSEIWRRIRFWNRRDALDRELSAELGEHLELLARDFEQSGLPHDEAVAAARRQLGNTTRIREESRDSWGFRTIESVLQDFRHALRALRFTIAVVITLGLGLGATTAIFSVVNGVLLRPLPFPHEDRLITLCEQY